jgi:hypothetical protein
MSHDIVAGPMAASMGGQIDIFDGVVLLVGVFGAVRSGFGAVAYEPPGSGQAAGVTACAGAGRAAIEGRFKVQNHKTQDQLRVFLPPSRVASFARLVMDLRLFVDSGVVADRGRSS